MKSELWRNGKQTITAEEDVKFEVQDIIMSRQAVKMLLMKSEIEERGGES